MLKYKYLHVLQNLIRERVNRLFHLSLMAKLLVTYGEILFYLKRTIINHNLYTYYPLFEIQKHSFKDFFFLNLALCIVRRAGYVCARTVSKI